MSESDFQRAVCNRLGLFRRRVLRVSDGTDSTHGVWGLRAITDPRIDSTGADLLVLPDSGMPCVLARSSADVAAALKAYPDTGFFLELKDPFRRKRTDQIQQERWLEFVRGSK